MEYKINRRELIDKIVLMLKKNPEKWEVEHIMLWRGEIVKHKELGIIIMEVNDIFDIRIISPFNVSIPLSKKYKLYKACQELKSKKLYERILNEHLKEKYGEDINRMIEEIIKS